jgi:hemerythrin-like domain-containing protein
MIKDKPVGDAKGSTGLDAIALLREQHRDVEKLFRLLESAEPASRATLFEELADAVALHSTIEERIFYPGTKSARTEELLEEAVQEHLSVKRLLADMLEAGPDGEHFDAQLKVLKEQIDHHVEEEENQLFPAVRAAIGAGALQDLGTQMEALVAELQDEEPRREVPSQTDAPAPV